MTAAKATAGAPISVVIGPYETPVSALLDLTLARSTKRPTIVLDLTGRGAALLDDRRHRALSEAATTWVDLADRARPAVLARFEPGPHRPALLRGLLEALNRVLKAGASQQALRALVEAAGEVAGRGAITLATLAHVATRVGPPRAPWRRPSVVDLLGRVLDLPVVRNLTAAEAEPALGATLPGGGVCWIEAQPSHMTPTEHQCAALLAEVAVADRLMARAHATEGRPEPVAVLHLLPRPLARASLPPWILATQHDAAHTAAIATYRRGVAPLSAFEQGWVRAASTVAIVGAGRLAEIGLGEGIAGDEQPVEAGRVRLFHRETAGCVTLRVEPGVRTTLSHRHRVAAFQRRMGARPAPLIDVPRPTRRGLFARLDEDHLRAAWGRIWASGGRMPGTDGDTVQAFRAQLDQRIARLAAELRADRYRPAPLRRHRIPKASGGERVLSIPTVTDRLVQYALLELLGPPLESLFHPRSFGFRPQRSAHQAIEVLRADLATGMSWCVRADVADCFDRIDRDRLLSLLGAYIDDPPLLRLVARVIEAPVEGIAGPEPSAVGVAQGGPLSPLLVNLYLTPVDEALEAAARPFARYADDFALPAEDEQDADAALATLLNALDGAGGGLRLRAEKTRTTRVCDGFEFLGFRVDADDLDVPAAAVDRFVARVRTLMATAADGEAGWAIRGNALAELQAVLRGFGNYYARPGSARLRARLGELDEQLERMAGLLLPPTMLHDPVWVGRPRLAPQGGQPVVRRTAAEPYATSDEPVLTLAAAPRPATGVAPTVEVRGDTEDADILLDDRRLIVLRGYCALRSREGHLEIYRRKALRARVAIDELDVVLLQAPGIHIAVDLQVALGVAGVPLIIAGRAGVPAAIVQPVARTRSDLRALQATRRDDAAMRDVGRGMVSAKVANQAALLRYFGKHRGRDMGPARATLSAAADAVRKASEAILEVDPADPKFAARVMGHEGKAAATYWRALGALVPADLGFEGRRKRDAEDPVNGCLNYGYGVLYAQVWRAILLAGLDPYFGFVHGSERASESLVFDLVEEFRAPLVDRTIVAMIGRGFRPQLGRDGRLSRRTRRLVAAATLRRLDRPVRRGRADVVAGDLVMEQARSLAAMLRGGPAYAAFRMRW